MKNELNQYVSRIEREDPRFQPLSHYMEPSTAPRYRFRGDGQGDFEKIASDASLVMVEAYLKDCLDQVAICQEIIRAKTDAILKGAQGAHPNLNPTTMSDQAWRDLLKS